MSLLNNASHLLITGATGLIGGELVRDLLETSTVKLSCLVRRHPERTAEERLRERLLRSGDSCGLADTPRLAAVEGDITTASLGLSPGDQQQLASEVDIIVHAAADTSFISGRRCRETNIEGVENLIAFARSCKREPLVVYVSTACNVGAVSHTCLGEEDGCLPENRHHNEYTRTKAIAETRLRESGLPLLIVRPSIVLSAGLPDPVFARQILWIAPLFNEFECLPIDPQARLDVVPVGFVIQAIRKLLELPKRQFDCYNLSAGREQAISLGDWIGTINRFYHHRAPLALLPRDQWDATRYVQSRKQRQLYFAIRHYLPFLNMDVTFDNSRLAREVGFPGYLHPSDYLNPLLRLIPFEEALQESLNP